MTTTAVKIERVGFSGTQHGMCGLQRAVVALLLQRLASPELHHGDCTGADAECHDIAKEMGCRVVTHPPLNPMKRAFKVGDEAREPKEYIPRDHDIVDETEILIAAPLQMKEVRRSGTWATIRYAWRVGKKVLLVTRDGVIQVVEGKKHTTVL